MRKKKKVGLTVYLVIALTIATVAVIYYFYAPVFYSLPQLSILDYVEASVQAELGEDRGILKLTADCQELIMVVTTDQAISIEDGLSGSLGFRPNTHDLMKDMLSNLGAEVLMIKIEEMRNGTYFANLLVKNGNLILSLDSRPSDAIAIGIRMNAPIYINKELLGVYGKKIC